ncbi:Glycosyl transferase family 2 [Caminicella sporogenes DSM 14501]|uniref:Glycosyl transferase family 2 n=1 Tax=Caminicella sporogenes DSM 14501 TaxID=1121266 RepID=A0A1M6T423_9FIRM|nr:glycosyltransferase family A protein [Caminicella sporogenes]SHK51639.1 Glycosyl transferase family 2 [Caminicella sporogenes DSM 14501]
MIYTIVPVRNEENSIESTLKMLLKTKTDKVLILLNGSTDNTLNKLSKICSDKIELICFNKPLGLDVPRAIGAYFAYKEKASAFIFVDGDMKGDISSNINDIIIDISKNKVDMALTNCYPHLYRNNNLSKVLLAFRKQFNIELGIFNKIGYAIPSHGPHGISKKLLETVGFKSIAVPPISLALAVKNGLNIKISTEIPNYKLGSNIKDEFHAKQIAKTIIGDCIEALSIYRDEKARRGFNDTVFLGYHKNRRFDILEFIINAELKN